MLLPILLMIHIPDNCIYRYSELDNVIYNVLQFFSNDILLVLLHFKAY